MKLFDPEWRNLGDIRKVLVDRLNLAGAHLVLGEVTRHRFSRQLEDNTWVKFVNTTSRYKGFFPFM